MSKSAAGACAPANRVHGQGIFNRPNGVCVRERERARESERERKRERERKFTLEGSTSTLGLHVWGPPDAALIYYIIFILYIT